MRVLVITSLLLCAAPAAARDTCYSDQDCVPWKVCTVSLGECGGGGDGDGHPVADVCVGTCVAGRQLRVIPRLGAAALDGTSDLGAVFGLEVVPPVLGGHVSLAVDYFTHELLRAGAVVTWAATEGLTLGLRGDVTTLTDELGAMVGGRLDWFPLASVMQGITPAHYLSIHVEGGAWFADAAGGDAVPFATVGLGIWVY